MRNDATETGRRLVLRGEQPQPNRRQRDSVLRTVLLPVREEEARFRQVRSIGKVDEAGKPSHPLRNRRDPSHPQRDERWRKAPLPGRGNLVHVRESSETACRTERRPSRSDDTVRPAQRCAECDRNDRTRRASDEQQ